MELKCLYVYSNEWLTNLYSISEPPSGLVGRTRNLLKIILLIFNIIIKMKNKMVFNWHLQYYLMAHN